MGTLTFTELKDEVRAGLSNRTDLDTRLGRFLNLAQQRLARLHDFDEMESRTTLALPYTGADSDKIITIPSLRELYSLRIISGADSRKLKQISNKTFDRQHPYPEYVARNWPHSYILWGNSIEVYPLPHQAMTAYLRYTKWPTDLSAANGVSEFNQKDDVLIELALAYAFWSLGKEGEAQKHEAQAMRLLGEADSHDREKPDLDIAASNAPVGVAPSTEPWRDPFVRGDDHA